MIHPSNFCFIWNSSIFLWFCLRFIHQIFCLRFIHQICGSICTSFIKFWCFIHCIFGLLWITHQIFGLLWITHQIFGLLWITPSNFWSVQGGIVRQLNIQCVNFSPMDVLEEMYIFVHKIFSSSSSEPNKLYKYSPIYNSLSCPCTI